MAPFNAELFLIAAVIVFSALLSGLVERSGLPQVAVFLGLGAILGPNGLNLVSAGLDSPVLRVVAALSLVLVLFTDAVSLNITEVRQHRLLSALVLGPGTLFSAALIALLSVRLLGLGAAQAAILGAALASTDPVLLRGLLRKSGVHPGVRQALRLEGGMNDAVLLPVVLVGMTIISHGQALHGAEWARLLVNILVLSPVAGIVTGLAAIGMLEMMRRRIGVRRDYESIYSLGVAFASFAAAESVHGSGYLAAFAAGVTISALDVELCDCFLEYGETTAEMALMFAFVLVGTSLIWTGLGVLGATTLLFTAAVFAARVVAFVPALLPARLSWPDRLLIAWFGPRGLSSLLLVLLPVFAGLAESERLVPICCLVVLCSVVLHGLSPMLLVSKDHAVAAVPGATAASAQGRDGSGAGHKGLSATRTHHAGADSTPSDPEYISIEEVEALRRQSAPVVIVDARSERTYNESSETIPGSVRLHPDQAVRAAAASALPRDAVLAVFCA